MKIDDQGNFCEFRGLTVVAGLQEEDSDTGLEIYKCIANSPLVRDYYSLLPPSSYHMTAMTLFTEMYDGNNNWEQFVKEKMPFIQQLVKALDKNKLLPIVNVESVHVSSVIQLSLSMPEEQKNLIHHIANSFGLTEKLPSEFHITLAYRYKSFESFESFELFESTVDTIKKNINLILKKKTNQLSLKTPKVCYFNDMTAFIPWNGEDYPFEVPSLTTNPFSWFNFRKSKTADDKNHSNCLIM